VCPSIACLFSKITLKYHGRYTIISGDNVCPVFPGHVLFFKPKNFHVAGFFKFVEMSGFLKPFANFDGTKMQKETKTISTTF
jgi:hypothetical protein